MGQAIFVPGSAKTSVVVVNKHEVPFRARVVVEHNSLPWVAGVHIECREEGQHVAALRHQHSSLVSASFAGVVGTQDLADRSGSGCQVETSVVMGDRASAREMSSTLACSPA